MVFFLHSFVPFIAVHKISVSLLANSFLLTGSFQLRWDAGRCTHSEFHDLHCILSIHSLDSVNLNQTIEVSKYSKNLPCPIYFKLSNIIISNMSDKNIIISCWYCAIFFSYNAVSDSLVRQNVVAYYPHVFKSCYPLEKIACY